MRTTSRWPLVVPVVALGLAAGCCRPSGTSPAGGAQVVADRPAVLADMKDLQPTPPDAVVGHVNEWGTGGALVVQVEGGARVAFRDRIGPRHESVEGVAVSPDGQRLAYAAREQGRVRMVVDGTPGPAFDQVGEPVFSRDGRHLAYRAKGGGRAHLDIDGQPCPVVGEVEIDPFQRAGLDEFVVVERAAEGGALEVVAYGFARQRRVLAALPEASGFLPGQDGRRLAAVTGAEGAMRVVDLTLGEPVTRAEGELFEVVTALRYDRATGVLMYVGTIDGQAYAVRDGAKAPIPAVDVVEGPLLEPAGRTVSLAYVAEGGVRLATAFGGTEGPGPAYGGVNELTRSPDGKRLAFAASRATPAGDEEFVVVDGVEAPERWDRVVSPRFSPDGRFLVYRARKDGQRMVVIADHGGRLVRKLPAFEQVFVPTFTADGKAVAYAVKDGAKLRWRVDPL